MSIQNLILILLVTLLNSVGFAGEAKDKEPHPDTSSQEGAAASEDDKNPEAEAKPMAGTESFSSAVNVIRKRDRVEVVFRNGESYYLPSGGKYNEIFEACRESEQSGKAISVTVHSRSRVIVSVGSGSSSKKAK